MLRVGDEGDAERWRREERSRHLELADERGAARRRRAVRLLVLFLLLYVAVSVAVLVELTS